MDQNSFHVHFSVEVLKFLHFWTTKKSPIVLINGIIQIDCSLFFQTSNIFKMSQNFYFIKIKICNFFSQIEKNFYCSK